MAAFSGTTDKCKACDTTVHFFEMISADGVPYHKNCFRCSNCKTRLSMSNYHSLEGNLFCKAHFEQRIKETGIVPRTVLSGNKQDMMTKTPSRVSAMFTGTQEKCSVCKKTVYPQEKVTVEGDFFHKICFRCAHGGCKLNPSNYAALDGIIYCKPHFSQLFKEKGSYNTLNKTSSIKRSESADEATLAAEVDQKPAEEENAEAEAEAEAEPEPEAEAA
ncbi:LIM domain-containing protein WLIM2b [Daucus carota subsp. sativus]|uniref:LIM domain-containing protein WLIM2b n=1 Tax=Daucus carota subsp. sativus TaxID=79200 RepID=UPI0007B25101|nr:PREDICTED: LIM domain-containing protein WLIM2b-like [Daucus carota subsp. sativus]